jgi:hypothetical protein
VHTDKLTIVPLKVVSLADGRRVFLVAFSWPINANIE